MAASSVAKAEEKNCFLQWGAFQMRQHTEIQLGRPDCKRKATKAGNVKGENAQLSPRPPLKKTTPSKKSTTSSSKVAKVPAKKIDKTTSSKIVKKKIVPQRVSIGVNTDDRVDVSKPTRVDVGVMVKPEKTPFSINREETQFLKELAVLKVEMEQVKAELNTEKSNRMVAEQLYSIVQQDLGALQIRMITESNAKTKMETALADCKVELSHTERMLAEKEDRITELEENLRQSNRLAQKLEDQSLMTRVGRHDVDYLLDMQLNKTKTAESQKKLEICQNELLQSREETQKLLNKVEEMMQERSEMVTHRIHAQLLRISDARADEAEKRVQEVEKEMEAVRAEMARMKDQWKQQQKENETVTASSDMKYGFSASVVTSKSMFSSPFSSVAMANTDPYSSIYNMPMLSSPFAQVHDDYPKFNSKLNLELDPNLAFTPSSLDQGQPITVNSKVGMDKNAYEVLHRKEERTAVVKTEETNVAEEGASTTPGDTVATEEETSTDKLETEVTEEAEEEEGVVLEDLHGQDEGESVSDEEQSGLPDLDDIVSGTGEMKKSANVKVVEVGEDSSDWGSSSEDEATLPSGPPPPVFSIHDSFQSPEKQAGLGSPSSPRTKPPPVKPKPLINMKTRQLIYKEVPSSFRDPLVGPSLRKLQFQFERPHGPLGRRLPSRYLFPEEERLLV